MTSLQVFNIVLNGFDETGQNGDRNGNVADGDQNGDDFRETLQPGRVDRMAEAERLKHTPQAVIEVITKHDHSDDVEEGDGPDLEAGDDVVVDIVFIERTARVQGPEGQVEEVEDYERQDDWAAPLHGARGVGGIDVSFFDVTDGASCALQKPELPGRPNVQDHRNQQGEARGPQEVGDRPQKCGIVVDFFGWFEDLEIAEQVTDDETEQDEAGDGHDCFFADGGLPEPQAVGAEVHCSSVHGMR